MCQKIHNIQNVTAQKMMDLDTQCNSVDRKK
jgi:hypothetical protein